MGSFMTDEFNTDKKSLNKFLILLCVILIVVLILVVAYLFLLRGNGDIVEENSYTSYLNSELRDTYLFAVDDEDYIVSIDEEGNAKRIYNLLQGTTTVGSFKSFTYHKNKIYLMFSNNSIYTVSLNDGNSSYQMIELFNYPVIKCSDNTSSISDDISINDDILYFNGNGCGIGSYYFGNKKVDKRLNFFKQFTSSGVYLAYNKLTSSLYAYSMAESKIYRFDEKSSSVSVLVDNVNSDRDIEIVDDVILYTVKNSNGSYDYYGYNLKSGKSSLIVKNVLGLIRYKDGFIYYTDKKVNYLSGNLSKTIYSSRYDKLSDVRLIGKNVLQVVDRNSNNVKVINIDLVSDYKVKEVNNWYRNIKVLGEIDSDGCSN